MLCAAHRVASPSGARMRIFRSLSVRHICANSPLYRSLSFSLCSLWLYNCKRCILRITFPSRLRVLPWEGLDFPSTDSTLLVISRLNFTQILSCSLHSLFFLSCRLSFRTSQTLFCASHDLKFLQFDRTKLSYLLNFTLRSFHSVKFDHRSERTKQFYLLAYS